jgi:hypothetical protein
MVVIVGGRRQTSFLSRTNSRVFAEDDRERVGVRVAVHPPEELLTVGGAWLLCWNWCGYCG